VIGLSIRRPVAVAMGYLALALLGGAAWRNMPVELLPDTQHPRLTVEARWPGASPETVEAFLTSPIEGVAQQLRGVSRVSSESAEGSATVTVEFNPGTEMDFARLDLSERLAGLEEELPAGVERVAVRPYVPREFESRTERAILRYTVTGPYTMEALRRAVDEVVVPELSRVEGVALVEAAGGRERVVEVELDRDRMEALGLSAPLVAGRIRDLDLVREAGVIREGQGERVVTIRNRPASVEEIRAAVLATRGGRPIRVADVAVVRDAFEEARSYVRIDGSPAVSFQVVKAIGANTVRVADGVKARLQTVNGNLPAGSRVLLRTDQSEEIRTQLSDLRTRALVSAAVIFAVLLLFLRSLPSAAIVFATIAFSVLIALNLIYFGGMSLNLFTLMGLALGFGLVVDNSIVVLENVFRRRQGGESAPEAAWRGAGEVVLPILASTATTLIVFLPFLYLQGELRLYYIPLAVAVALTLGASLVVAFTFIPALAARLLAGRRGGTPGAAPGPLPEPTAPEGHATLYVRFYSGLLHVTLRFPWLGVGVVTLALLGSYRLFDTHVTRGALWGGLGAQRTFIDVQIRLPRGLDLERTEELTRFFEERIAALPQVRTFESSIQESSSRIQIFFPDSLEHTAVPPAIKDRMMSYSLGFTGVDVRVYGFGPSFYGGAGGAPNYSILVLGYNYDRVREIAESLGERLRHVPRVQEVDTNASAGFFSRDRATEFVVEIDREALARHDLTVEELVQRLNAAVRGRTGTTLLRVGEEELRYEVKLEGFRELDVRGLKETLVSTSAGTPIRLGDVMRVELREVLARILREDEQYQRVVAYEFRGPQRLGDLWHDAVIQGTEVPPGYTVKKRDSWRFGDDQRRQLYLVLAVALALVFMVTSALFESLRQPLVVLLTLPMSLIGVFLIFFYLGATFSREAYVAVIMMGGVVVNNAILLLDHMNRVRRESGLPLLEAIHKGTLERVRPILMTTTSTVAGLLPLVLFSRGGADGTIWNALAYTLIGGLLASTLLVLTVTPALYLLVERGREGERVGTAAPTGGFGSIGPLLSGAPALNRASEFR